MNARRPVRLMELRSTYGWGGGPDKTILHSAAQHDPARVEVDVVYLRGANDDRFDIGDRGRRLGVDVVEIPERGRVDLKAWRRLAGRIRRRRPDILHSHDSKTNVLAWLLKRRFPWLVIVATSHGWVANSAKMQLYARMDLFALRRFPCVIAVSAATRGVLLEHGVAADRIFSLHNGIDVEHWRRGDEPSTLKTDLGFPEACRLVGSVGRLGDEKDLSTFLAVARRLADRDPDVRFALIGEGPRQDRLEAEAERLGLTDRIRFTGYRQDLLNVYRGLDVHLITSLTEGLPNNLLEAMAMGVPTVSTAVGGIREIITDERAGALVAPGDVDGLTAGVARLLEDPEFRDSVIAAGRRRIEEAFSFSQRLRKIEGLYEQLVGAA